MALSMDESERPERKVDIHPARQQFHPLLSNTFILVLALLIICSVPGRLAAQSVEEIPIERCDTLPVIKVKIQDEEKRFLIDTAATSILNDRSFSKGESKQVAVSSWRGVEAASAREVVLPDMQIGTHHLYRLRLSAIDLSQISRNCGGRIDGILGVDLMDKMGITLDLKRRVAQLEVSADGLEQRIAEMKHVMHGCSSAFIAGQAQILGECFDPGIVLYTQQGEFHGRKQVMEYLQARYLKYAPDLHYTETIKDAQMYGDVLWYSYDYAIDTPREHTVGHGMGMCRRSGPRWRVLNMNNSVLQPEAVLTHGPQ